VSGSEALYLDYHKRKFENLPSYYLELCTAISKANLGSAEKYNTTGASLIIDPFPIFRINNGVIFQNRKLDLTCAINVVAGETLASLFEFEN
jgi:hypothetical protein